MLKCSPRGDNIKLPNQNTRTHFSNKNCFWFKCNQLTVIPISETTGRGRRGRAESPMGEFDRIPDVLHSHVSWFGKHLEISVHCLRKWRRRLSDTVHHSFTDYWTTPLLPRDVRGTIFQQGKCENVRSNDASFERYRCLLKEICWVTTRFYCGYLITPWIVKCTCRSVEFFNIILLHVSTTFSTSCVADFDKLTFTFKELISGIPYKLINIQVMCLF